MFDNTLIMFVKTWLILYFNIEHVTHVTTDDEWEMIVHSIVISQSTLISWSATCDPFLKILTATFLSSSTIISWGKSREKDAFERVLDEFSSGPVSVVSDSYDIFHACKHIWGDKLKERVMERGQDSCLVIRPDSGDPAETLIEVHTGWIRQSD